jgi:glycosyltransferase involved in cell wall biosynthesis
MTGENFQKSVPAEATHVRMQIAFVTPESPYGTGCGVAAYLRAIIPAIVTAGHRVTVIANAGEEREFTAESSRVNVCHFRLPSFHWQVAKIPKVRNVATLPLRQFEWSLAFYRRVARLNSKTKIDVIESTEIGSLFLHRVAPLVIRLHGSERTFREHSGQPLTASVRWNDRLEAKACERASAITAPSKFHANEIARRRNWPTDRIQVIPNAISEELLVAASKFHRNGHNERIVLYAGRLAPVKGIDTLLEAAKKVRAIDPSIKFVLAGPWQMPSAPDAYGLKNDQGITWVGPQTQEQIGDWYQRASLLVMPSNYESFGIAAVEALAFDVPVIAAEETAVVELAETGGPVSFVPKFNPKALADRIVQTISAPNGHSIRTNGNKATLERFKPQVIAEQTLKLYQALGG